MAFVYQIRLVTLVCIGISTLTACNASFMKASPRSKTTALADLTTTVDAAGNVSAAFDPNSKSVQVLRLTSGSLAGSGVALPPGALSLPVSITVGEGETLAASGFTQQLGLGGNAITAAGPSVSFIPSENVQANSPFTLSIPFSRTSLTLADGDYNSENLIILYRWMKVNGDDVRYEMGIIPRDEVTVSSTKVSFDTTKFGVFQIGISETKIAEKITIATEEPPALKADASNPLVGSWGQCHKEGGSYGNQNGGTTTGAPPTKDWTSGNTTPLPPSCNILKMSLRTEVVNYPAETHFSVGVSFNGASPWNVPLISFSQYNNSSPPDYPTKLFYLAQGTDFPASVPATVWAPPGCNFVNEQYGNTFMALGIRPNNIAMGSYWDSTKQTYVTTCDVMASSLILKCDGSLASNTPPPYNPNTDGTNSGSKGGDAPFGYVPGVTYSAYDVGKFTSSTFTHIKQTFDGPDCTGNLVTTMIETGSYELVDVDVAGTIPINLNKDTKVGTIYDAESINAANSDPGFNGCGFTDWVSGVQKDLTSSSCSSTRTTNYSRIKIDGDKMYFCDHSSTSSTRADYGTSNATRAPNCDGIKPDDYLQRE